MDEELRAAVERYRSDEYPDTCDGTWLWEADCHVIADAYIRDLDQRAAQQAEHELPVDEEFVASIARQVSPERYKVSLPSGLHAILWRALSGSFSVWLQINEHRGLEVIRANITRGELLDLLHGLGATDEDLARLGAMNTNEKGEVT